MKNPFRYNRATLSSGFYFDYRNKCICYLDTEGDEDNPYMDNNTVYNRFVGDKGYSEPLLPMPMSQGNSKVSAVEDLVHLSILESYKLGQKLNEDFNWIYNNGAAKESFKSYLLNEELYSLLYLFDSFINEKELSPEELERRNRESIKAFLLNANEELKEDGVLFFKFPD